MSSVFEISRLAAQGDGVADTEKGQVFISYTLPGEEVTAAREKDRASLIAVLKASPQRIEPACRHFGDCGGCSLQHMEEAAYRDWKRDRVVQALRAKSIDTSVVGDLVACQPASRRRVTFTSRRTEGGMLLGYNRQLSHHIVDIQECPVALPSLQAALPLLRQVADRVCATPQAFHMTVTQTETGLDIATQASGRLDDARRHALADFVIRSKIARLTVDGEIIVEPVKPVINFGSVAVTPPPGCFLQSVAAAEQTMVSLVTRHLHKAKRVADLFAGAGAFTFPLAQRSEVLAVEGDAPALAALDRAARHATGLKRVTHERRDLFRRPLTFKDLAGFDGLVFDPPRAGAEDQSRQIARSDVPLVAAVSCNPVTLARDLRLLIDGGYKLASVTPVDQFLWSAHVEAVALLEKPRKRR